MTPIRVIAGSVIGNDCMLEEACWTVGYTMWLEALYSWYS
jgi:hypothetical protein